MIVLLNACELIVVLVMIDDCVFPLPSENVDLLSISDFTSSNMNLPLLTILGLFILESPFFD